MTGGRPKPPGVPAVRGDRMARLKKSLPTVRVVPPVVDLLNDIYAVAKTELARLRSKQTDANPYSIAKDLDSLASAVTKASRRDAEVQREMAEDLQGMDEEALRKLAAEGEGSNDQ